MKDKLEAITITGAPKYKTVRVVNGADSKIVPVKEALNEAAQAGLDLVLINGSSNPPVCKILDLKKMNYENKKKEKEMRRNQRASKEVVKEIQFKPNIDVHDFKTKCNKIIECIDKGNKVKILVRFKGRERQNTDLGFNLIDRILGEVLTSAEAQLVSNPQFNGNQISAMIKRS